MATAIGRQDWIDMARAIRLGTLASNAQFKRAEAAMSKRRVTMHQEKGMAKRAALQLEEAKRRYGI